MIVISDTSPINYLILIDHLHVLPELFHHVVIPQAVYEELSREHAPEPVREWVASLPDWVKVRSPDAPDRTLLLGAGEQEAITLAQSLKADAILLDDFKARKAAAKRGLVVMGTLGVLERASQQNLIDLTEAFDRLQRTTFHGDPKLMKSMLERETKRKRPHE